ncbi:hypothetical protein SCALM49S_06435 [Streptomyces californicus]
MENISRATRAAMMLELSPLLTAANAPASSIPASRSVSWSKPTPVTRRPPNPDPSRRITVGSWSITATVCLLFQGLCESGSDAPAAHDDDVHCAPTPPSWSSR